MTQKDGSPNIGLERPIRALRWPFEIGSSSSGIRRNNATHLQNKNAFTASTTSYSLVARANQIIDLSLEFLMGRALDNAMLNVGLKDVATGLVFTLQANVNSD